MSIDETASARRATLAALSIGAWKGAGRGIAAVTAYDAMFARLADEAGADAVLVGDSVGPVLLGKPESDVTLAEMIHHGSAVRRGLRRAALVLDVPPRVTARRPGDAAAALVRAAAIVGAAAVKIEGSGRHELAVVRASVRAGLCVVGHLTPSDGDDAALGRAAAALAEAGAAALVLQNLPPGVAARITAALPVATISVGSGDGCDGALVNVLEVMGLRRSPHASPSAPSTAPAADAGLALLTAFCAATQRERRG